MAENPFLIANRSSSAKNTVLDSILQKPISQNPKYTNQSQKNNSIDPNKNPQPQKNISLNTQNKQSTPRISHNPFTFSKASQQNTTNDPFIAATSQKNDTNKSTNLLKCTFRFDDNNTINLNITDQKIYNLNLSIHSPQLRFEISEQCKNMYRALQNQYEAMMKQTDKYYLPFCQKILKNIPKTQSEYLRPQQVYRLKIGFLFYNNHQSRNQFMKKILEQNSKAPQKINKIKKTSTSLNIDLFLAHYFLEKTHYQQEKVQQAILDDQIDLVQIYKCLSEDGRVSDKKYLKEQQQLNTEKQMVIGYQPTTNNISLGKKIIEYFQKILIKNPNKPAPNQIKQFYTGLLTQLDNKISIPQLKSQLDNLIFQLHINCGQRSNLISSKFRYFSAYFIEGKTIHNQQMQYLMQQTSTIQQYKGKMKEILIQKLQIFTKKERRKNMMAQRSDLQEISLCLFFLEQVHKIGMLQSGQFLEKLMKILFYNNHLLFLERLIAHQLTHFMQDKAIPILFNYINGIPHQQQQVLQQIKKLCPSFSLKGKSPSIILKFLIQTLKYNLSIDKKSKSLQNFTQNYYMLNKKVISYTSANNFIKVSLKTSRMRLDDHQENKYLHLCIKYCDRFKKQECQVLIRQLQDYLKIVIQQILKMYIENIVHTSKDINDEQQIIEKIENYSQELNSLFSTYLSSSQQNDTEYYNKLRTKLYQFYEKSILIMLEKQSTKNPQTQTTNLINHFLNKISKELIYKTDIIQQLNEYTSSKLLEYRSYLNSSNKQIKKLDRLENCKHIASNQQGNIYKTLISLLKLRQSIKNFQNHYKINKINIKSIQNKLIAFLSQKSRLLITLAILQIQQKIIPQKLYQISWPIYIMYLCIQFQVTKSHQIQNNIKVFMIEEIIQRKQERTFVYRIIKQFISMEMADNINNILDNFSTYFYKINQNSNEKVLTTSIKLVSTLCQQDVAIMSYLFYHPQIKHFLKILQNYLRLIENHITTDQQIMHPVKILLYMFEHDFIKVDQVSGELWKRYLQAFSKISYDKYVNKMKAQQILLFIDSIYYLQQYLSNKNSNQQASKLMTGILEKISKYVYNKGLDPIKPLDWLPKADKFIDNPNFLTKLLTIYAIYINQFLFLSEISVIPQDTTIKQQPQNLKKRDSFIYMLQDDSQQKQNPQQTQINLNTKKIQLILTIAKWICKLVAVTNKNSMISFQQISPQTSELRLMIISKIIQINICYYRNQIPAHLYDQFQEIKNTLLIYKPKSSNQQRIITHSIALIQNIPINNSQKSRTDQQIYQYIITFANPQTLINIQAKTDNKIIKIFFDTLKAINYSSNNLIIDKQAQFYANNLNQIHKLHKFAYNFMKIISKFEMQQAFKITTYKNILDSFFNLGIQPCRQIQYDQLIKKSKRDLRNNRNLSHSQFTWHLTILNQILSKNPSFFRLNWRTLTQIINKLSNYVESWNLNQNHLNIQTTLQLTKFQYNLNNLLLATNQPFGIINRFKKNLIMIILRIAQPSQKKRRNIPQTFLKFTESYLQTQENLNKDPSLSLWCYYQSCLKLSLVKQILQLCLADATFIQIHSQIASKLIQLIATILQKFQKTYLPILSDKNPIIINKFLNTLQTQIPNIIEYNHFDILLNNQWNFDTKKIKNIFEICTQYLIILGVSLSNQSAPTKTKNRGPKSINSLVSSFRF